MRSLLAILFFLITFSASAEVVAGRRFILFHDAWAPDAGGPVTRLPFPITAADFDGDRFLIGWNDGDGNVRLGIIGEGAPIPFSYQIIDGVGDGKPFIRWDGSRYVVAIDSDPVRLVTVSRQGVVEMTAIVPDARSIAGVAASHAGIALVSHYTTNTLAGVVEVLLLDRSYQVASRATVGSVAVSTGFGARWIDSPRIVPFGSGFYVAWREKHVGRFDRIVGTRVTANGAALDTGGGTWSTATVIDNEAPTAYDLFVHPYGERLAVQTVRDWGSGLINTFIEPNGAPRRVNVHFGTLGLPHNVATVQLTDGSIAAIYVKDEVAKVAPLLKQPPARRRSTRS